MMKKMLAILLAVLLAAAAVAFAAETEPATTTDLSEPEAYFMNGFVLEVGKDAVLVQTTEGMQVQVNLTEDTAYMAEHLLPGDYVYMIYNGMMTRSLPAQITAMHIGVYVVEGSVTAVEDEFVMILREDTEEEVMMTLPENAPELKEGDRVIAYTNGAMTMSLPPQMNAIAIVFAGEATPAEAQ